MPHKLGRLPRKYDERIPSSRRFLELESKPPLIPVQVDYSAGLPDDLGAMRNNSVGDCTAAAFYHARQIWTAVAGGSMITESDDDVLKLYSETTGYNPAHPATDQGGVEQDVLSYLLNTGAPTTNGVDKIAAYVEVDPRDMDYLRRVIVECGAAYVGIEVPQSVMDNDADNTIPWDTGGDTTIIGGHAVAIVGYNVDNFICISWGRRYKMTPSFLAVHLDEAYGIIDRNWVKATGNTPFGMTLDVLENSMAALKYAA